MGSQGQRVLGLVPADQFVQPGPGAGAGPLAGRALSWHLTAVPGVPELMLTHLWAWPVPDTAECRVLGIPKLVLACFWVGVGHS